jgi:hypothetical protein
MILKSTLIGATAIAIALTGFDLRPAAAASDGQRAIAQHKGGVDEISAARKRRRGVNPAIPLAAFGALAGTIASVAAANRHREYYDNYYHAPAYYGGPAYDYNGPPAYQYYAPPPRPHYDYYSRWGGSGGQPGYRGPNVNVPGATNYGNAAGQNGQAPPLVTSPPSGGSN